MDQQFNPNIQSNPPVEQLPKKKIWPIIILIVVGVLAVGGGVYYLWQKLKTPTDGSLCEKGGGKITNIIECDGVTKSQVCTFPDNTSCYTENIIGGKCTGNFSPKVLCDKIGS